jgi:hypothetical protein
MSFDQIAKRCQGQVFRLSNQDIVVVLKGVTIAEIDDVVLRLRYMLDDDPLVHEPDDAPEDRKFCDWFDIEQDHDDFLDRARALHREARAERARNPNAAAQPASPGPERPKLAALDPVRLARLDQVIGPVNVRPLLRRQPICSLPDEGVPKVVSNELYVSIDALGQQVAPTVDLRADPWLFQYLITRLDRRVMAALPELEAAITLPTGLNLTIEALGSAEFLAFDDRLRAVTQKTMLAEIHWLDALRDMSNFAYVRDLLRLRKWRIAIDGLSVDNFALINGTALDPDYLKLAWTADFQGATPGKARAAFMDALERTPRNKLVLMHCGEAAAIRFGRSVGVTLFQGRHVDAVLKGKAAA